MRYSLKKGVTAQNGSALVKTVWYLVALTALLEIGYFVALIMYWIKL